MKPREITHHGRKQYVVQYTIDGKRRRKFFPSKSKANTWIAGEEAKVKNLGQKIAQSAHDDLIREAVDLSKKLEPHNASLSDAVQFYIKHLKANGNGISISDLRESLLSHLKADKDKSALTIKEVRQKTQVFMEHFGGDTNASAILPDMAREWLNGLEIANRTKNHYRTKIGQLYNYGIKYKGLETNPFEVIDKLKVKTGHPGIFTKGQMKTMLDAAKGDAELTAWIAIGAYAGIRPSEMERMDWSMIDLKKDIIKLPAAIIRKSTKERIVDIRPKLKKILQSIQQLGGPIVPSDFTTCTKYQDFKASMKFDWIFDGLRHSFGTYHLRGFRHAGETSLQMGHGGSVKMLQDHYDNPTVTKDEALAWWDELPTEKKTAKKRKAK